MCILLKELLLMKELKKKVNHVKNRQESVRIIGSRLQTNTEVSPVQQLPVRELKKNVF